ncbi:MAG: LysR family transcriptional regulator [Alphaproteobacteria bacterium]|nr:LysR family transcriptional regulator [Alphaproteobacteria bacterium]
MDLDVLRTFVEIVEAGSFKRAAERLNVTQSTVSMRVKSLEEQLGRVLFQRSRAGLSLTPAGLQLQRHAPTLLQLWQRARQEIALPAHFQATLSIGGLFSLWDRLLLRWLPWMRQAAPAVALRAEVGTSDILMHDVLAGRLDIVVLYSPQSRAGLVIEQLLEERLVMVETPGAAELPGGYVFIDWGPEFLAAHSRAFPDRPTPPITVSLGALGLAYILENGGSGYFPLRVVRPYLSDSRLRLIDEAPRFGRPAYVVYPAGRTEDWFATALAGLRQLAAEASEE